MKAPRVLPRLRSLRRAAAALVLASASCGLACYGDPHAAIEQLVEARRLAADMRLQLHRAAEAEKRAVMADTEEASTGFARQSDAATAALRADLAALGPRLADLRFEEETRLVAEFEVILAESEAVDRELLALATQNTNVEAQRLAFGPGQELADGVCAHVQAAAVKAAEPDRVRAELLATRVERSIREIQALQSPHIAEADDAVMTRLEARMEEAAGVTHAALDELSALVAATAPDEVAAARADLERFAAIHREIVSLSRRNTDVYALALSLGRKRNLTAQGDATLAALQEALAKRGLGGTR